MKFSRDEIMAQGVQHGSQSVYLTGFSYAAILSATELLTHRYRWTEMEDNEWNEIDASVGQMMKELFTNIMIGTVVPYMGAVIPDYLLLCDGGTHNREDYPDLYNRLPVSLHVDADTFTVPDMAGRAAVGASTEQPLLSEFGEATHTLTENEIPAHSHTYTPPTINIDLEDVGVPDVQAAGVGLPTQTGSTGGGQPHNNMQPSIALYWCVVAR